MNQSAAQNTEAERNPAHARVLDGMARREAVVHALAQRALATSGQPERSLTWMGVERQAERYLREARVSAAARRLHPLAVKLNLHCETLRSVSTVARVEIGAADEAARGAARRRLGLRLALVGRGGAGKTMICATLTRVLARRRRKVLAADLDTSPGLAYSLGLGAGASGVPLALEEDAAAPYGWRLAEGTAPGDAVERFAAHAPDGARLLSFAKIDGADKVKPRQTITAVRQILDEFGEPDWDVVGDLAAGPTSPFERYHSFADRVVIVVGPAWRSALTAQRLLPLIGDVPVTIVANRFTEEPDHPGLAPAIRIPFDPEAAEAERLGVAPLDHCLGSPAVEAVEQLAELLLSQEVSP